ncbi:MAG: ion channel [Geitlerinemataceae cyanobacterium]
MKFRDRISSDSPKRPNLRRRFIRIGQAQLKWVGEFPFHWSDLYHWLLMTSWVKFFSLIIGGYFAVNFAFAVAYLFGGNGIENARPGSFADAFFFSVQTMATIGYGAMYPKTAYANVLVTLEALLGLLGVAMATGLMFARFSRPTARVLFSKVAVICPYDGVPTLMFRAANQRHHKIIEAQIRVSLLREEVTPEGHSLRRFYDLDLARSQSPIFALSWLVMHPIDRLSPLYGETFTSLVERDTQLIVILTGLDETVSQTVHASQLYIPEDFRWNHQFVDILSVNPDGSRHIDYPRFHDTFPFET